MRRARDLLVLVVFAAATAWLGWIGRGLTVDVENVAMRATGTPEEALEARREAAFGRESTLIVLLEPRKAAAAEEPVRAWIEALETAPGALRARRLPVVPRAGGALAAVDLAADDAGAFAPACASVDAAARTAAPAGWRVSATGPIAGSSRSPPRSGARRRACCRCWP